MSMLSPEEWEAVWLTLAVAARAVGFGLPVAVAVAWVLARYRFPGRAVLNALVHLPMALPPVVTGWLLLVIFGVRGPIGSLLQEWFGIRLVFTTAGAALACAVMSFPIMVRSVRLGAGVDRHRAGASGAHAGCWMARPDVQHHAAARLAGHSGRRHRRLRHLPGRVRRGHHLCRQHTGTDADAAAGDLQRAASARRRGEGGRIVDGFADAGADRPAVVRMDRQAAEQPAGPMSFSLALRHRFPSVQMDIAFEVPSPGVTVLFGPSGSGKSTHHQCGGRAAAAR